MDFFSTEVDDDGPLNVDADNDDMGMLIDMNDADDLEDREDDEQSDDDFNDEDEDETGLDYNDSNPFFKSLIGSENKIVELIDLTSNMIKLIQSHNDDDREETFVEAQNTIVNQYLQNIRDIKTNLATHVHRISKFPVISFETNNYMDRKKREIEDQKMLYAPDHLVALNNMIKEHDNK
ncbi:hypothetical protein AKO1_001572, partial [Acrasis kona]